MICGGSALHGWLAAEAGGDIAAAEAPAAGPDVTEPAAEAGFGLPVGDSGPIVEAGWLATTFADGREGSDAGARGTGGSGALAGTTMAVAGTSACLVQAARRDSAPTAPQIANRFIRVLPCGVRANARSPAHEKDYGPEMRKPIGGRRDSG